LTKISDKHNFAILYPKIAEEWDYENNGELKPEQIGPMSNKKVNWICNKGHKWSIAISERTRRGIRCRECKSLAVSFPEICKIWHPTKNGNLTPDQISYGSGKEVWWKCPVHYDHEWPQTVNRITSNIPKHKEYTCPFCDGQRISETNRLDLLFPELIKEWDFDKNEGHLPNEFTTGSDKVINWKCPEGPDHRWHSAIKDRTGKKTGCPCCSIPPVKVSITNCLATVEPTIAKEWHSTKNGDLTPYDLTAGSQKKVWWLCKQGHTHDTLVYSRVINFPKSGCRFCDNKEPTIDNNLEILRPDVAKEWHPTKNGNLTPSNVTVGSRKKVYWKCPKGADHEWASEVYQRVARFSNSSRGCPCCAGYQLSETNSITTIAPEIATEFDVKLNNGLTPDKVRATTTKKYYWRCSINSEHVWRAQPAARCYNFMTGCPKCNPKGKSLLEIRLAHEIQSFINFDISEDRVYHEDDTFHEVDLIIKEHKLLIEYDGHHWHKDKPEFDKKKTEKLIESGWKVIRIREEPLEAITENDVFTKNRSSKKDVKSIANITLKKIEEVCNIKILGLDNYLRLNEPVAKRQADEYIAELLREEEQTTLEI